MANQQVVNPIWEATMVTPTPTMGFQYRSGDRPIEGYTIKRGLGRGGFGEVYYALSDAGKEVALKLILHHLDIELRGVMQCLNLKHPNLVSIYDIRTNATGEHWLIMEYMAGRSLQDRLQTHAGPIPWDEANNWLVGIAQAVDYLHQHGIVHRDLKPGNVFSEEDQVKLGDYGLSKFITVSRRSGQTQSVGTVHYMAPEISTGNYSTNVDVYAFAVIAFELLTGEVPFDGESAAEILMKHLTAEPNLNHLDPKYHAIFTKALAKNPESRFQSAGELLATLQQVAQGASGAVPTPEPKVLFTSDPAPAAPLLRPKPKTVPDVSLPPLPGTLNASRRAVADTIWTIFQAGLAATVLPLVILALQIALTEPFAKPSSTEPVFQYIAQYIFLMIMGGTVSASLLLLGRAWEHWHMDSFAQRLSALVVGVGLGAVALFLFAGLYQVFPVSVVSTSQWSKSEFWTSSLFLKELATCCSLFGLTFLLPDWRRSLSRQRRQQFSLWGLFWVATIGFFLSALLITSWKFLFVANLVSATLIVQWLTPSRASLNRRRPIA